MKKVLGLDLGTNSIGWALIENDFQNKVGKILGAGSRIIPMTQDVLGKFDSGVTESQTAVRTGFRGIRRLRERHLLRRERLHRVLNVLGFLPPSYQAAIDFDVHPGKFKDNGEPKLAYTNSGEKTDFIFKHSFYEMVEEFKKLHPHLFEEGKLIPYDWTIYYLRKKALSQKIEKEELAWIILNFNQKRGYYQLRGELEEENTSKREDLLSQKVVEIVPDEKPNLKGELWYTIVLENGFTLKRSGAYIPEWLGKTKDFIVSTELNEDGSDKTDGEGQVKRSFRAPSENDWGLLKKKTEKSIEDSQGTVGEFIYTSLLKDPNKKIKGALVKTVERKYYKDELKKILQAQVKFHPQLNDTQLYEKCCNELYQVNEGRRNILADKGFIHLFIEDIIFYQRPLKSQKSGISDCKYEYKTYLKEGEMHKESLKCAPKSHPLFQEFRVLQFLKDLKIIRKFDERDITDELLPTIEARQELLQWLMSKKEIQQKDILKYPPFGIKKDIDKYRWNYVEDKIYPLNETYALFSNRFEKLGLAFNIMQEEARTHLWHMLYSIHDKAELKGALEKFAQINNLGNDFADSFSKLPPYKSEYCAYSQKALKKMLPLMRFGTFWGADKIDKQTIERIDKIIFGEYDEGIRDRVREKAMKLQEIDNFQNLPTWLVSYIVYDRHSEGGDIQFWKKPSDISAYLKEFKQHSLRNPIVEQVLTETLRVVEDIWNHFGNAQENFFDEIHIELGREMKNPSSIRKEMTKQISENENTNLRIQAILIELFNSGHEGVRPHSPFQQDILKIYEDGVLSSQKEIPSEIEKISKNATPSKSEIMKYKLWLDQKYRSPYTGKVIPLSRLFTSAYEIEHIIPQSRYFDDSFTNKVICESAVNKDKDNLLAYEYIRDKGGSIIDGVKIFNTEEYEAFVRENYSTSRSKMKKLLLDEIPDGFIQRQLNDSRYISRITKNLLSNIVRAKDEQETVSKNLISTNGNITSRLKKDWGMNDVWNEIISPRFQRLNNLTNSKDFGDINPKTRKFLPDVPFELKKGFDKKRIDHRHHAMDAIVIACATRSHVNYLNNESALGKKSKEEKQQKRFDLQRALCTKQYEGDSYTWQFEKPWKNFTIDAKTQLDHIIVSFKNNVRVINKAVNYYQKLEKNEKGGYNKIKVKQTKGNNWAIRKALHKDTVAGRVTLTFKKEISLNKAIEDWENIVDVKIRKQIKALKSSGMSNKDILKELKSEDQFPQKLFIYYKDSELAASRVALDITFSRSKIESITDSGIQKILLNHLKKYEGRTDDKGKIIAPELLAFSPEGIEEMNNNLLTLNHGKGHKPIYKVRTYEPLGNKFSVGYLNNKASKFVEAAKGTNLFFAIYSDEQGVRNYTSVPLIEVVERLKQFQSPVPEQNEKGDPLLFYLTPNDLVSFNINDEKQFYKFVSCTGNRASFIPANVAKTIFDKFEFGSLNKIENLENGESIKKLCNKINPDRLGR